MKQLLLGFVCATFIGAAAASASVCTTSCNHDYSVCNTLNGGSAQGVCMPKWMQCKKTCLGGPAKTPTKVSNMTPAPKH
jgi:hypothetical protein